MAVVDRSGGLLLLAILVALVLGVGCLDTSAAPFGSADVPALDVPEDGGATPADTVVDPGAVTPDAGVDLGSPEDTVPLDEPFSFFVTSLEAMRLLSGSQDGFGGDLGGLAGADEICRSIAATVEGGHKTWRAFLSATKGDDGQPVHAIDRIGEGPWYDRNGRLVALDKADLLNPRPIGDPQIVDDLPNEYGQGQKQYGDNHDTLTGSNAEGRLHTHDPVGTCQDWTSKIGPGSEKKVMGGHSWPREHDGPGGGTKIPPPLLEACVGKSGDDACSVSKGPFQFEGTCQPVEDGSTELGCLEDGKTEFGPAGGGDPSSWMEAHTVPGCAPGVQLLQEGGGQGTDTVGGGGGYGGIYCFALEP